MRALVLGGTGMVGRYLLVRLLNRGWRVDVVGRSVNQFSGLHPNLHLIPADLGDAGWIDRAEIDVGAYDAFYHLAYATTGTSSYDRMVTVDSVGALLDRIALVPSGCPSRQFVYAGSMVVFGQTPVLPIVDETHPRNPDTDYAAQKIEATTRVLSARDYVRPTVLHPTGIYTAGSKRIRMYVDILRQGYIVTKAGARGINNIVHADDVAAALLQCLNRTGTDPEEYIINGECLPMMDWLSTLEQAIGCFQKPRVRLEALQLPQEKLQELVRQTGARMPVFLPEYKLELFEKGVPLSFEKARRDFCYEPRHRFQDVCADVSRQFKTAE